MSGQVPAGNKKTELLSPCHHHYVRADGTGRAADLSASVRHDIPRRRRFLIITGRSNDGDRYVGRSYLRSFLLSHDHGLLQSGHVPLQPVPGDGRKDHGRRTVCAAVYRGCSIYPLCRVLCDL